VAATTAQEVGSPSNADLTPIKQTIIEIRIDKDRRIRGVSLDIKYPLLRYNNKDCMRS
jgi:hypothetical protein